MQTIRTKRLFTGSSVLQNQEIKVQNGKIISVHRHNGPFMYDNTLNGPIGSCDQRDQKPPKIPQANLKNMSVKTK